MRRARGYRWVGWAAALALLAQAWLAPLATLAAARQAGAVVICTGAGFKIVTLPGDQRPFQSPHDRSSDQTPGLNCAACLHQAVGQGDLPAPLIATCLARHEDLALVPVDQRPPSKPFRGAARSRAPPLV